MARTQSQGPTAREAEILAILWDTEDASVEQIRQGLRNAPAASTVRKLLSIMVQRRLVRGDGRAYARRYRAVVSARDLQAPAVQRLLQTLFAGSAQGLVQHLLSAGQVSVADLRRLARTAAA